MDNDTYPVDPFLVEALQNPRHRLAVLRMEQDIQQFLQNSDAQQFEFQVFSTSYLRLAAHRVSQHYGLQTMVQDNALDGLGTKIIVRKLTEHRHSSMHLSEIPIKQLNNEKNENVKIGLMQKSCKTSSIEDSELGIKCSHVKTVEERMEDYDRARARIFSSHAPSSSKLEDTMFQVAEEGNTSRATDPERSVNIKDEGGLSSRVAIFKDREKDLTDPDYDRSYKRYTKPIPSSQSVSTMPLSMERFHGPFVQYGVFPQVVAQQPMNHQSCVSYGIPVINPFCANGLDRKARDPVVHMQWPTSTMMYAQSYDQLRQTIYQAPPYNQQPLSFFDYSQNY